MASKEDEICTATATLKLGENTEVDLECGVEMDCHGEYHQAGQTLKEGDDGYPDAVVLYRWRDAEQT